MNVNTSNIKQLFGTEELPGLSRNGLLISNRLYRPLYLFRNGVRALMYIVSRFILTCCFV